MVCAIFLPSYERNIINVDMSVTCITVRPFPCFLNNKHSKSWAWRPRNEASLYPTSFSKSHKAVSMPVKGFPECGCQNDMNLIIHPKFLAWIPVSNGDLLLNEVVVTNDDGSPFSKNSGTGVNHRLGTYTYISVVLVNCNYNYYGILTSS